jgi:hypothetical protein
MASQALVDFKERTNEVEQLIEAHSALTRLRRAEKAMKSQSQTLQSVATVIQHLVSQPGPGRPQEVHALNNAAIALLSAHLQGFVKDLYEEAASRVLDGKVSDVPSVIKAANTRGNPNEQNITKLFESIGFPDILDGLKWQRMSNKSLRGKLRAFNELRNRIVHSSSERVHKSRVSNYLKVMTHFAEQLDSKLERDIRKLTGHNPW